MMKIKNLNIFLNFFVILVIMLLIGFFLFLRFYKIDSSFFFFNDIGRDLLVLYDWHSSGKPPLLGPQNSALPFNQSAVYFYLLYPLFILTDFSLFSTMYTNALIYIICLVLSLFIAKEKRIRVITLLSFILITIHPQVIIQNRFVWNPSLVPPLILLSTIAFLQLFSRWSTKVLTINIFSLAAAASISFSIVPVMPVFFFMSIYYFRQHVIKIVLFYLISLFTLNLPTILFEFRHSFLLLNSLLTRKYPQQNHIEIGQKLNDFIGAIFMGPTIFWNIVMFGVLILLAVVVGVAYFKELNLGDDKKLNNYRYKALLLFFSSFVLTLALPVNVQAHYIFGILTTAFIFLATLPIRWYIVILLFYGVFWLRPEMLNTYFQPASRTVAQLESCFTNVCQQEKDPIYVSVQAGFHPYHNGPEFRYLMKKNGCNVQSIEEVSDQASKMAVVVDQSTFNFGRTNYLELATFNPTDEVSKYSCDGNVQVHILQK